LKFIHAADFHLCTSYRSSSLPKPIAAQQRELLWESFLRLIETCKEESADLLLLCGDLYESAYAKSTDSEELPTRLHPYPIRKFAFPAKIMTHSRKIPITV
jgi:DNA repair exonuclease SbcCD nuclease subunit